MREKCLEEAKDLRTNLKALWIVIITELRKTIFLLGSPQQFLCVLRC